jgi:hypothetical protein
MTTEQRASKMIEAWTPHNLLQRPCHYARTACAVHDITEDRPIPKGAVVSIEDFWRNDALFVVEGQDKIYLAEPSELIPHYG